VDVEEVAKGLAVRRVVAACQRAGVQLRRHQQHHACDERDQEPRYALAREGPRPAAPERVPDRRAGEGEEQRHAPQGHE
jgi:hypothetical protein